MDLKKMCYGAFELRIKFVVSSHFYKMKIASVSSFIKKFYQNSINYIFFQSKKDNIPLKSKSYFSKNFKYFQANTYSLPDKSNQIVRKVVVVGYLARPRFTHNSEHNFIAF